MGFGTDQSTSSENHPEAEHTLLHPYQVTKDVNVESQTDWRLTIKNHLRIGGLGMMDNLYTDT